MPMYNLIEYSDNYSDTSGSLWILKEMKVGLSLHWTENCVLTTAANASKVIFNIIDAKLDVLIVTLSAEGNIKLSKLLSEGFKRTVY